MVPCEEQNQTRSLLPCVVVGQCLGECVPGTIIHTGEFTLRLLSVPRVFTCSSGSDASVQTTAEIRRTAALSIFGCLKANRALLRQNVAEQQNSRSEDEHWSSGDPPRAGGFGLNSAQQLPSRPMLSLDRRPVQKKSRVVGLTTRLKRVVQGSSEICDKIG